MDDQNRNLILATALSFLVILVWFTLGPMLFPDWFPEQTEPPAITAEAPEATGLAVPPGEGTTMPMRFTPATAAGTAFIRTELG